MLGGVWDQVFEIFFTGEVIQYVFTVLPVPFFILFCFAVVIFVFRALANFL